MLNGPPYCEISALPHATCWLVFEGREINTRGDGLLATFVDPAHAVDYATCLRDVTSERALQVRSGIHFGEVKSVEGNDTGGVAVHIGARTAGAANPGEVLVSRMVAAQSDRSCVIDTLA
jgi:class 3 adenylate cyclase